MSLLVQPTSFFFQLNSKNSGYSKSFKYEINFWEFLLMITTVIFHSLYF